MKNASMLVSLLLAVTGMTAVRAESVNFTEMLRLHGVKPVYDGGANGTTCAKYVTNAFDGICVSSYDAKRVLAKMTEDPYMSVRSPHRWFTAEKRCYPTMYKVHRMTCGDGAGIRAPTAWELYGISRDRAKTNLLSSVSDVVWATRGTATAAETNTVTELNLGTIDDYCGFIFKPTAVNYTGTLPIDVGVMEIEIFVELADKVIEGENFRSRLEAEGYLPIIDGGTIGVQYATTCPCENVYDGRCLSDISYRYLGSLEQNPYATMRYATEAAVLSHWRFVPTGYKVHRLNATSHAGYRAPTAWLLKGISRDGSKTNTLSEVTEEAWYTMDEEFAETNVVTSVDVSGIDDYGGFIFVPKASGAAGRNIGQWDVGVSEVEVFGHFFVREELEGENFRDVIIANGKTPIAGGSGARPERAFDGVCVELKDGNARYMGILAEHPFTFIRTPQGGLPRLTRYCPVGYRVHRLTNGEMPIPRAPSAWTLHGISRDGRETNLLSRVTDASWSQTWGRVAETNTIRAVDLGSIDDYGGFVFTPLATPYAGTSAYDFGIMEVEVIVEGSARVPDGLMLIVR